MKTLDEIYKEVGGFPFVVQNMNSGGLCAIMGKSSGGHYIEEMSAEEGGRLFCWGARTSKFQLVDYFDAPTYKPGYVALDPEKTATLCLRCAPYWTACRCEGENSANS